jgi:hypothetical protein
MRQLLLISTPVTDYPDESRSYHPIPSRFSMSSTMLRLLRAHGLQMVRITVHAHESTYSDPYAHHATGMLVRLTTSRRKVLSTTEILNFSQSILLFGTLVPSTMRNR